MLTQKSHVLSNQNLINMVSKTIKVMENIYNKTKRILFLFALVLTFASCELTTIYPSHIIKNVSSQEIVLQYVHEIRFDSVYNQIYKDTIVVLKPQEMHQIDASGWDRWPDPHGWLERDFLNVLDSHIRTDTLIVRSSENEVDVLRVWVKDFEENSQTKELYRMSDWKFVKNIGITWYGEPNDAYVFEIKDSDLISE